MIERVLREEERRFPYSFEFVITEEAIISEQLTLGTIKKKFFVEMTFMFFKLYAILYQIYNFDDDSYSLVSPVAQFSKHVRIHWIGFQTDLHETSEINARPPSPPLLMTEMMYKNCT
jgi:hypothetical protein